MRSKVRRDRRLRAVALICALLPGLALPASGAEDQAAILRAAIQSGLRSEHPDAKSACAATAPELTADGRVMRSKLLDTIAGFAKEAGTTGGLGKQHFVVTSLDDERGRGGNGPPGGLREALLKAEAAGGGWISFAANLPSNPAIHLAATLKIPSNTTIDGGCSGITIWTDSGKSVMTLEPEHENIVLTRLNLEQRQPIVKGRGDCITVSADRVWVAYSTLRVCEDGLIDIGQKFVLPGKPLRVTIAFNRFSQHEKDMLIATYECNIDPSIPKCANPLAEPFSWSTGVFVTVQSNLFDETSQRHPKASGSVYVHMINNVVVYKRYLRDNGAMGAAYGSWVGNGGRMISEGNVFVNFAGPKTYALQIQPGKGALELNSNVIVGSEPVSSSKSEMIERLPYKIDVSRSPSQVADRLKCTASRVGPLAWHEHDSAC